MAVYKRRWYHNIYFEFYLNIPLLTIQTRVMKEAIERMAYDICLVRIKLYKWSWEFKLYKTPDLWSNLEPRIGLSQRLMRALRQLRHGKNAKSLQKEQS
jgi:hypothetical protein